MTPAYNPNREGPDQVEQLLDAYAEARLEPAGPLLARIRIAVLADAAAAAADRRLAAVVPRPKPRFALPAFHVPRRAFALGMAATLTMGTAAAVLAAPPGSLFYNARLSIEVALMPPVTDIDARLAAYEEQFTQRIREAEAAIDRGDQSALGAALAAYQNELLNALAELGTDTARLTHLEDVLATHIAKLEVLAERLPTAVARQNAVEHAIQASQKAVEKIKEKKAHQNSRPSDPPGPGSNPPNRP